jgi:hypothetical protein
MAIVYICVLYDAFGYPMQTYQGMAKIRLLISTNPHFPEKPRPFPHTPNINIHSNPITNPVNH